MTISNKFLGHDVALPQYISIFYHTDCLLVICKICTNVLDENTGKQIIKKLVLENRLQELYGGGGFKTTYTFNNPT